MKMMLKRLVSTFGLVSMLLAVFGMVPTTASPGPPTGLPGPYVDQHWWHVIISDEERMTALLSHEFDVSPIPDPRKLPMLEAAGYQMTEMSRIGQILLLENNRVWPFGTPTGGDADSENWRVVCFRKGVHRLVDKDALVAIEAPLKSKADWWLPPGQVAWINPDYPVPAFDPLEAVAYFDAGGFVQGITPNPHYDPDEPWSAEYIRIDPLTEEDLEPVEYYVIGPVEDPIGFEIACRIFHWLRKAGIPVEVVVGTWFGMLIRLINDVWDDYQLMGPVPIFWGSTAPDILYDFTYSENLPLWNFAVGNYTELDEWGLKMMTTLDIDECKEAAFKIQEYLDNYEPYLPLLLDNGFGAFTGPHGEYDMAKYPETGGWEHPGFIGIVNAKGFGALGYSTNIGLVRGPGWSSNVMGKMRGHANRFHPTTGAEINKWIMPAYLDSLNPMEADTEPDWQVLSLVTQDQIGLNPYTHAYEPWGATTGTPQIDAWVGPGRFQAGGNEAYDGNYDNKGTPNDYSDDTYENILLASVIAANLVGDDKLGTVSTWTLRDDLYWHDDDPAGVRHPVTTADLLFCYEMMINQHNDRYYSNWWYIWDIQPEDDYKFRVFEERRYLFSFEGHGIGLYAPKHIWEPYCDPTRTPISGIKTIQEWTSWTNDEHEWRGWEEAYMEDPQYPGQTLTKLIGFGPYIYHLGGWEPGVSVHLEANRRYLNGLRVCEADVNMDRFVNMEDIADALDAFGSTPGMPNWDPACDVSFPAQEIGHGIDVKEIFVIFEQFGNLYNPQSCRNQLLTNSPILR